MANNTGMTEAQAQATLKNPAKYGPQAVGRAKAVLRQLDKGKQEKRLRTQHKRRG